MQPQKTKPFLCPKDWGGRKLADLYGKPIPSDKTGESWEISAHPNGECEVFGMKLSQAAERYGEALLGELRGPFPLLIKLLDAQENLSVQVHPDDALAALLEGQPFGKTEAWVVLDPPESGALIFGTDASAEELRRACDEGRIEGAMAHLPVRPLDTVYIPAGTIHALTAGALVYEVQQSSDTTYRLYAWGRDAELHIESSLRAIALRPEGAGIVTPVEIAPRVLRLVDCPAFALDRLDARRAAVSGDTRAGSRVFHCLTALGAGTLTFDGGEIAYVAGESILAPASAGMYTAQGGELLRAIPKVPARG